MVIVFASLQIPTSEQAHVNNFNRIVSTLNYADQVHNCKAIFFYFVRESESQLLKRYLLIEYVAQYYSEILSTGKFMHKLLVIVLPFPSVEIMKNYVQFLRKQLHEDQCVFVQYSEGKGVNAMVPIMDKISSVGISVTDEMSEEEWLRLYPFQLQSAQVGIYGKYKVACLGGTFDRLHLGHQVMLTCLAMILNMDDPQAAFVIGLSGDALLQKKELKELIEPYEKRKENVINFLKMVHPGVFSHKNTNLFMVEELLDPYGPSVTVAEIEALVVSEETRKGGEAVNKLRVEKGMKPADLICIPTVQTRNNSVKLSSTDLRRAEAKGYNKK